MRNVSAAAIASATAPTTSSTWRARPPAKPGLMQWLLFGLGPGPGEDKSATAHVDKSKAKVAVKCDMGKDIAGGPSCVRSCPTGAAIRVNPEEFFSIANLRG